MGWWWWWCVIVVLIVVIKRKNLLRKQPTRTYKRFGSGEMFDHMAHYYDEMNRLISLGLDMSWRRSAVRHLTLLPPHSKILDVAMGTGDLSLALLQQRPDYHIVGIDPSVEMLRRAEKKLSRYASSVTFQQGVAEELPFSDDTFAAVMVAFGVRNFEDRKKGIAEMSRVMSRDAKLVILELGYPDSDPHGWRRWLNRIAESFIRYGVPYLVCIHSQMRQHFNTFYKRNVVYM
ncbi:Oxysterol-binding protein 9 [Galdieria sulphuraria]|nr:Oxysterol-binding protein 9 [Galdieria sulphuraria]